MTILGAELVEAVRLGQRGREWGYPDWHIAAYLRRSTGDPWTPGQVTALLATGEAQRIEYWQGAPSPQADPIPST